MDLVKVDGVAFQAAQAGFAFAADGIGFQTFLNLAKLVPNALTLGEHIGPGAHAFQRAGDDFLRMSESIYGRGVDPIDPVVECRADRGDRIVIVLRSPGKGPTRAAHGPSADADSGDM